MIRGFDVSHYQTSVDFKEAQESGCEFAFIKATEGTGNKDPMFAKHWANAQAAGIFHGAYHFFHPDLNALVQADHFLKVVGSLGPLNLPPVLDLETMAQCPKAEVIAGALAWLKEVKSGLGRQPIVYASSSFIMDLGAPQALKDYPLWLARYTSVVPASPEPWPVWTFWQDSENGHVKGVTGPCDTDLFNGTIEQLKKFVG